MPLVISNPKSSHLQGELWRLRQKGDLTLIPKSSEVRPCLSLFSFVSFSFNSPVFKSSTPKQGHGVAWLWTGTPLVVKRLNSRVVFRPSQASLTAGLPGRRDSLSPSFPCTYVYRDPTFARPCRMVVHVKVVLLNVPRWPLELFFMHVN